jgi:hypothetical protein
MFVRAIESKKRSVIYFDDSGRRLIRRGGTWAWRNNNPGNIVKGRKARSLGSIGVGGGFAIFPDYATGRAALRKVLKDGYPTTTLFRLIRYYAPPKENDVKRYRKLLLEFTSLSLKRTVEDLTAKELEKLVDGIERIEGWREGEEKELGPAKKIVDVKRDSKRRITGYVVEDLGSLSPAATVRGILEGEIDAIVAARGGRTYIRTRPDHFLENNLDRKGKR